MLSAADSYQSAIGSRPSSASAPAPNAYGAGAAPVTAARSPATVPSAASATVAATVTSGKAYAPARLTSRNPHPSRPDGRGSSIATITSDGPSLPTESSSETGTVRSPAA